MATLADAIERYIKELFARSPTGFIEIRRAELAVRFSCVPSQISYVLETRFTPERGYAVETRRGGGGYVRILRLAPSREPAQWTRWLMDQIGTSVSARQADAIIGQLWEMGLLSAREAAVWRDTLRRQTEWVPESLKGRVRASLLRGAIMVRFVDLLGDGPPA